MRMATLSSKAQRRHKCTATCVLLPSPFACMQAWRSRLVALRIARWLRNSPPGTLCSCLQVLRTLRYFNFGEEPSLPDRIVTVTVTTLTSGAVDTETGGETTIVVHIRPVDDAPVFDADVSDNAIPGEIGRRDPLDAAAGVTFTEGAGAVAVLPLAFVADDGNAISAVRVLFAERPDGQLESLFSRDGPSPGVVVSDGAALSVNFTFPFALSTSAAATFVRSLVYNNAAAEPALLTRRLSIAVVDSGGFSSAFASVSVEVSTVNDNRPAFSEPTLEVAFREGGTGPLVRLSATDDDLGPAGEVGFRIVNDDVPEFRIASDGQMTVIEPLDFEDAPVRTVRVQAVDNGTPQQASDEFVLTVQVTECVGRRD